MTATTATHPKNPSPRSIEVFVDNSLWIMSTLLLRTVQKSVCPSAEDIYFSVALPHNREQLSFEHATANLYLFEREETDELEQGNIEWNSPEEVLRIIPLSFVQGSRLVFFEDSSMLPYDDATSANTAKEVLSHSCATLISKGSFMVRMHLSEWDPLKTNIFCRLQLILKRESIDDGYNEDDDHDYGHDHEEVESRKTLLVMHSPPIRLYIQLHRSKASNIVQIANTEIFEWFNKYQGENTPIDVWIHLKDYRGRIVQDYPKYSHIQSSLLYEDGTEVIPGSFSSQPTTTTTASTVQHVQCSEIYRRLHPDPILREEGSSFFSFRIEETSIGHRPHTGFKLVVTAQDESGKVMNDIACGIMEEIIHSKSRPSKDAFYSNKSNIVIGKGGRRTVMQKALGGVPIFVGSSSATSDNATRHNNCREKKGGRPSTKNISQKTDSTKSLTPSKRMKTEESPIHLHGSIIPSYRYNAPIHSSNRSPLVKYDSKSDSLVMSTSILEVLFMGMQKDDENTGTCLFCDASLPRGHGLRPWDHEMECRCSLAMSPYIDVLD